MFVSAGFDWRSSFWKKSTNIFYQYTQNQRSRSIANELGNEKSLFFKLKSTALSLWFVYVIGLHSPDRAHVLLLYTNLSFCIFTLVYLFHFWQVNLNRSDLISRVIDTNWSVNFSLKRTIFFLAFVNIGTKYGNSRITNENVIHWSQHIFIECVLFLIFVKSH